jgi:hypothetical protein
MCAIWYTRVVNRSCTEPSPCVQNYVRMLGSARHLQIFHTITLAEARTYAKTYAICISLQICSCLCPAMAALERKQASKFNPRTSCSHLQSQQTASRFTFVDPNRCLFKIQGSLSDWLQEALHSPLRDGYSTAISGSDAPVLYCKVKEKVRCTYEATYTTNRVRLYVSAYTPDLCRNGK